MRASRQAKARPSPSQPPSLFPFAARALRGTRLPAWAARLAGPRLPQPFPPKAASMSETALETACLVVERRPWYLFGWGGQCRNASSRLLETSAL